MSASFSAPECAVLRLGLLYFGDKSRKRAVEFAAEHAVRRLLVIDAGHQGAIRFGEGFDGSEHIGVGCVVMRDAEFRDREREGRHQLLVDVNRIARNLYVEQRRVGRQRARVFVFVAMGGDQISAIDRAVDDDFALFSAADGADFFAFGGAESFRFSLFADWAGHDQAEYAVWQENQKVTSVTSCALTARRARLRNRRTKGFVRTCSGRNPIPMMRAGNRRNHGWRSSKRNGNGSGLKLIFPSSVGSTTRLCACTWNACVHFVGGHSAHLHDFERAIDQ